MTGEKQGGTHIWVSRGHRYHPELEGTVDSWSSQTTVLVIIRAEHKSAEQLLKSDSLFMLHITLSCGRGLGKYDGE